MPIGGINVTCGAIEIFTFEYMCGVIHLVRTQQFPDFRVRLNHDVIMTIIHMTLDPITHFSAYVLNQSSPYTYIILLYFSNDYTIMYTWYVHNLIKGVGSILAGRLCSTVVEDRAMLRLFSGARTKYF